MEWLYTVISLGFGASMLGDVDSVDMGLFSGIRYANHFNKKLNHG